jgi:tricorn protease
MHIPSPRFLIVSSVLLAAIVTVLPASATDEGTRLLRDPDVGPEHIVFVHAHDLWLVPRDGGDAVRLTSGVGGETDPAFSPDGNWIAYSGEHGGNEDVYLIPATGGQPTRLTWHPGDDVVQGWTPDGDVLFRSGRFGVPTRLWQFFTVSPEGGMPEPLALPQAFTGEMSADGAHIAYQEIGFWDPEWRNYRGGQAQPVSVVDTVTWERTTPPWEGERHMSPVWLDGVVYYISERDWAANLWSWNPTTGEERQCTFHRDFDVKSVGAGHGVVVYEQGGYLHEYDPAAGEARQLAIRVAADRSWSRPRWTSPEAGDLGNARLSPTGQRALFEYRGELLTVPAEHGSWRNITRTPGVADRHAVWSPDGQSIAWFNDADGEYALMVADQTGAEPRRIAIDEPSFYFQPTWSPDGTRLAFTDTHYRVLILTLKSGAVDHVDTDRFAHPQRSMNPVWSPDSRSVAYARRLDNQLRAIFVHDTNTGETTQITDGMADAIDPVWDEDGEYLFFLASTDYGLNTGWLDMTSYDRPVTRSLYVAILAADGASPFLAKSDEEKTKDEDASEDGEEAKDEDASSDDETVVTIDLEDIGDRIVAAPGLDAGEYVGLVPAPRGSVFVLEAGERGSAKVLKYVLEDREAEDFIDAAGALTVSFDRKKMLYSSGPRWSIVGTATAPSGKDDALDLGGLRVKVDPPAEWRQMLRDGWRFMRDFLYVDNVHGAPWEEVWTWYEPWLEDVHHRSDFNHLLDILSGEVAVGHSYVRGGDYPELDNPRVGLLGADLEVTDGGLRITRIYTGERWNPDTPAPLAAPGLDVTVGDVILAVDGRPWTAGDNPYRLLEGTADREITLTLAGGPETEGTRTVVVKPTDSEFGLRYWDWVEGNRRTVDRLSDGRLAYVWLPNTGRTGYEFFNRMYFAQQDRQGAVIDERNNGGGSAADYIVEVLGRELTGYFNSRAGDRRPFTQPMAGLFGPKVMIINERAGSGGDLLPYLFRLKGIGPLIGTRTWGGLVGTWDTPMLIDGGRFVAPRGGFFDRDGEWAVEGEGVAPDIEVRNDPAPVIAGEDPQLEAAVAEALRLLETEKVELKPEPAPPVRWRRPDPRRPEGPQTEEEQPQGQGQKQRQGQRTASETEADSGFRSPDTGLGSGHGRGRR